MEHRRRMLSVGWLWAVLVVAVACGPGPDLPTGFAPPVISMDPGLAPRLAPERVAGIVFEGIHADEQAVGRIVVPARIVRMTVTTTAQAGRIEPGAGADGPLPLRLDGHDVVWVVRAFGTFTNRRTPPGAQPLVAGSGYYIVADADGSILSFGFP